MARPISRLPHPLLGALCALTCAPAFAQTGAAPSGAGVDTLVVTATRTARSIDDVAATMSVKTAQTIEQELARDIRDLIRYEPGISVGGTGDRFGLGSFTIRGVGGNRVLTMVDGVRVADAYGFGPFLSANRDYVDVDGLKALEIVRGPSSALYGSDALGGVVAYRTKDAADYLAGAPFYAGFKAGYSGVDDSTVGTVTLATGTDSLSGMLLYTRRDAHETQNYGGGGGIGMARELPDPLEATSDSVLLKVGLHRSDRHRLSLDVDALDSSTQSQVLSDYGTVTMGVRTNVRDADDALERHRTSLSYSYVNEGGAIDAIDARIYTQTSEQVQRTREDRTSLASGARTTRWRDSFFDQDIDGLSLQADKRIGARHYVVIGGEYWSTDSASLRAGGTANAVTGAPILEFLPLPTRDFPPTSVDQYGLYVQDEIALANERLLLTPSLRADSFDATAHPDAIYFAGNPGQPPPVDFDDSAVSPKIGLLYALTDGIRLYAQYAAGFKAPPYDDVNVGFSNPLAGYKTIANPNLESETSRSVEIGVRFNGGFGRLSVVAFKNTYDDFIESLLPAAAFAATGGIDPDDGLLTFQSQNLAGVQIEGLEVAGDTALGERFALRYSLALADGTDDATETPLSSIDPLKAVLGVGYAPPSARWGADLVWTLVAAKDTSDIAGNRLATAGYGLVDLLGYYDVGERTRLNVGLFNLGDKRYIEWADTAALGFDGATGLYPEAGRFTRPGFNAGVTVRVQF